MISHWSLPPAESDSANLDHVAELMVRSGTDPQEALMALVPEAYRNHPDLVKHYPEVGAGLFGQLLGCLVSGWAVWSAAGLFGQLLMRWLAAWAGLGPNVPLIKSTVLRLHLVSRWWLTFTNFILSLLSAGG